MRPDWGFRWFLRRTIQSLRPSGSAPASGRSVGVFEAACYGPAEAGPFRSWWALCGAEKWEGLVKLYVVGGGDYARF